MNGAARSGKQNIVEGSEGMQTSLKTAIKLTNVAKASLEELIGDLEDFLRQRNLEQWMKNDPRTLSYRTQASSVVSNLSNLSHLKNDNDARALISRLPLPKDQEPAANLLLTLCHQATYLLYRQVLALEEKHKKEGGYSEKLYAKRIAHRKKH